MRVYLDTSVLVALLIDDALTARAELFMRAAKPLVLLSDFAAAEFASAVARRVRNRELSRREAIKGFASLDEWAARATERVETIPADIRAADIALRRLDLTLRTPDAIHIAIARRAGAALATFDTKMAAAATALRANLAVA